MSYILDALRRADSERERERSAVPGLHTQAVPVGAPEGETDAPANPWKWPIAAAFVALLGLVAWLWFGRAKAPEPALPLTSAPASSAPAAPLAAPAAAPAAPAPAPVAAAGPPAAPAAPGAPSAAPVRHPAPATARKPPAPAASAKKSPASAAAAASAAPRAPAQAYEPEVYI